MRARDTPWHALTRRKSEKFSDEFDMTFTIPSRRPHLRSQFLHRNCRQQPWPPPVQALEIRRNRDATAPHGRPSDEARRRTSLRNAMRDRHGRILPDTRNRIKASLSAFQRWKVKVSGFGVKARPRPQRMALRWCPVQFALVGAIGEACGEASRVSVSGTPPTSRGVPPLDIENRYHLRV